MKIIDRSYSSKNFRPSPNISMSDDSRLLIVVSSWGEASHGQIVIDEVSKYVQAAISDVEVTSPFEYLTALPPDVNHLRIGFQIANESIYRRLNKSEYTAAIEAIAILKTENMLSWVQVGHPSLFLSKLNKSTQALSVEHSISPNLPGRILGIESSCYLQCGSVQIGADDKLIMLASSEIGSEFYNLPYDKINIENVTQAMARNSVDNPFWVGIVNFID